MSDRDYVTELARLHGLTCLCDPLDIAGLELDETPLAADFDGAGFERAGLDGRNDFPVAALQKAGMAEQGGFVHLRRGEQLFVALDVLHYDEKLLQMFFDAGQLSGSRLLLITPEIRQLLHQKLHRKSRLREAVHGLARQHRGLSARDKTTYPQKLVLAFLLGLLGGGLFLSPVGTLYVLGGALNVLFLYTILLRLYAVATLGKRAACDEELQQAVRACTGEDRLPVYTILVPLFREQRVVGQLIDSLLALDYPRDRLDIKLIFESEDQTTLAAARACRPPDCFEFVIVPPGLPQTKPKALNYALPLARGRYVVVFDAEDRPQPDQLRKAVAAFERAQHPDSCDESGEKRPLACLQAGLNHYNSNENWLAKQFTIEYTSLFDGLLPALQRLDLPILLGGTSNHFQTDILRRIGGWDAFNVTEDADLGIRLVRFGYRCAMLPSTTYEEACCRPRDWVRQRTRWLKGWLQTYLVHMRNPVTLFRQLGARGFAGFQIVLGAQVLSLVAHPVFIVFMAHEAATGTLFDSSYGLFGTLFWGLALGNFILGYAVTIWLGFATLRRRSYGRLIWQLPLMPLYWLLISFATFRALVHYVVKPFYWEKTEHGLKQRAPGI